MTVIPEIQMPNPSPDQLAAIRRLLPPKTDNTEELTKKYMPLLQYLEDELDLKVDAEHDQHVYTAGGSILWCARSSLLADIEEAYENAIHLRQNGDGGGHAMLSHILHQLGYTPHSSNEAERIAEAVIRGQL